MQIEVVLPDLRAALQSSRCAVLTAPPGAGKTTGVPPALLDEPWLAGRRIVMLEPRRLAARAAAHRMAALRGEELGATVGYSVRLERRVSARTRIEVVTEGILTRRLQNDPELRDVGLVIFDEFHERSVQADLGLALTLDVQSGLRDDLRILVMSATLDAAAVAELLGGAPVVRSAGRSFDVVTRYVPVPAGGTLERHTAAVVLKALAEEIGSVLVFLPGEGEIKHVARLLHGRTGTDVRMLPLYGNLPRAEQDTALLPAPVGARKVVLATSIAETSLTIEGVRVVIDSGYTRVPRFDPRSGMTRLETVRISRASAEQRRGRAGRTEPGVCYRLWAPADEAGMEAQRPPEIRHTDLAPLALELAAWGAPDARQLRWLDPPPQAAFAQAQELLQQLGALDAQRSITPHGRAMAALGCHPRLAHMLLRASQDGYGDLAALLAALLEERDILYDDTDDPDLTRRIELLQRMRVKASIEARHNIKREACRRILTLARMWERTLHMPDQHTSPDHTGRVLAYAYPDRIAQRRPDSQREFLLANGRGAQCAGVTPIALCEYIVVADLDARGGHARIFSAAPYSANELLTQFADQLQTEERVAWDDARQAVRAWRETRFGALVIKEEPLPVHDGPGCATIVCDVLRTRGMEMLPWTPAARQWQARVLFLRGLDTTWPDVSDAALLASLDTWLAPHLAGVTTAAQLQKVPLFDILQERLSWKQRQELERLAPTHIEVPSGSRIMLDYTAGAIPVLAVRVQELFGLRETPRIAGGRVAVLVQLLSPARRPVQVTQDLASFWRTTYQQVRKDLRGRYPKHYWPEDPFTAVPTRRTARHITTPGKE